MFILFKHFSSLSSGGSGGGEEGEGDVMMQGMGWAERGLVEVTIIYMDHAILTSSLEQDS